MTTRANPVYLTRLRRLIHKSAQNVHTIARMSGIPTPVLHRFVKGERGLNADTAEKLANYLELRDNTEPLPARVVLDLIAHITKGIRHLDEQIERIPNSDERESLEAIRREYMEPSLTDLKRLLGKHYPDLVEEETTNGK